MIQMTDEDIRNYCQVAVSIGLEKKAQNPMILDLKNQGAFTDYFVLLTAANARQVSAVSDAIRLYFKNKFGLQPVAIDGRETNSWVLMDFGAFFIHVFQENTRQTYQLEQLWSKGRMIEPEPTELDSSLL